MKKYIIISDNRVFRFDGDEGNWYFANNNPTVFKDIRTAKNISRRVRRWNKKFIIKEEVRIIGFDVPVEIQEKIIVKYRSLKLTMAQKVNIMNTVVMSLVNNVNLKYHENNIKNFYDLAIKKLEK